VVHREGMPAGLQRSLNHQIVALQSRAIGDAWLHLMQDVYRSAPFGCEYRRRAQKEQSWFSHLRKYILCVLTGIFMRFPSRIMSRATVSPAFFRSLMYNSGVLATSSRSTP